MAKTKQHATRLHELQASFSQDGDSLSDGEVQDLRIEVVDAGAGPYFVLKTNRWAFDSLDDLKAMLERLPRVDGV